MKAVVLVPVALFLLVASGCSVYMAATAPTRKDMSVAQVGALRSTIAAEWLDSYSHVTILEKDGNTMTEEYLLVSGPPFAFNIFRCLCNGAADVFTFCLWEVVGTPLEVVIREVSPRKAARITYVDGVVKSFQISE